MTFSYRKTPSELREAFDRQVRNFRRSIASFDDGHIEEAERLATSLYTLFFDGGSNAKSAAKLAGVKDNLRFPDSRFPQPKEPYAVRIGPPLCVIGLGGRYWPRNHARVQESIFEDAPEYSRLPFKKWWEQVVYSTDSGRELSRKNLVFSMRTQDGGAHIDKKLKNEAYHWLSAYGDIYIGQSPEVEGHDPSFVIYVPDTGNFRLAKSITTTAFFEAGRAVIGTSTSTPPADARPIKYAHWASMRQIAWEANVALTESGL